jgi:hypothetical protein
MKPRIKPPKFIALCARVLTERPVVIVGFKGHPVSILRDSGPCTPMMIGEPCEHSKRALAQRICDRHGLPIVEVLGMPAQVPVARPQ